MKKIALISYGILLLALIAAPFLGFYPVFVMKVMCFALFACAFNLLLGYTGLLSFGHAAFLGGSAYVTGHVLKVWGLTPELGLIVGTLFGAGLGLDVGGEAEVGTEFEAGGERGEHLHGGGGGYHVIGVTGKFHPVVTLYDDGVLAPLGRGQRGGLDRQRKESTKTNQQPLHRIL